jgi:hypothetical protein
MFLEEGVQMTRNSVPPHRISKALLAAGQLTTRLLDTQGSPAENEGTLLDLDVEQGDTLFNRSLSEYQPDKDRLQDHWIVLCENIVMGPYGDNRRVKELDKVTRFSVGCPCSRRIVSWSVNGSCYARGTRYFEDSLPLV